MIRWLRARDPVWSVALAVALCVTVALVHVHVRLQVIQVGYQLGRENRILHQLTDQNQKLRLELATRQEPSSLEAAARDELHMTPPAPQAIRLLRLDEAKAEPRFGVPLIELPGVALR